MRIAHRATSLADAEMARDVLAATGIPAHIADRGLWDSGLLSGSEVIRVMVDNGAQDRARRALDVWRRQCARREQLDV
jgi:hypothetical protein